ncbi:hypothetical protein HYS82_01035 [Candidatus Amesbacteria bacterium]|nr:hypothetical protein [Candidatus Amesbacteria bacterium]
MNTDLLRAKLKLKSFQAKNQLLSHHPHVAKLLAAGATAGSLLLSPAQPVLHAALPSASENLSITPFDLQQNIRDRLKEILPGEVGPLTDGQESQISGLLHDTFGIHALAELEGNRLNHQFGLIGAEQHLMRYPGDVVENMAPGRGAWGYFAYSKSLLTPDLIAKEKYYVAVQTLYLPDWNTRLPYLRDWYKFRKVIVLNPVNGRADVAVIADSGPAAWTGKHFGGSPEVMADLQLNIGKQKGPVIMFFVDDPENKVPLGPLEYNLERPSLLTGV